MIYLGSQSDEKCQTIAGGSTAESLVGFLRLLARCIDEEADSLEADPAAITEVLEAYRPELLRWGLRAAFIEMGGSDPKN